MLFTALHRVLGRSPGPLTDDMVAQAVDQAVAETTDLDWKSELPPAGGLTNTDYPKDVAALANAGGGVLVYGVTESERAATGRKDTGDLTEAHAAALTAAAVSAISPPVFGVEPHLLGTRIRAVVVVVPASIDVPHLIYRNKYFGAPLRNGPDTEWMKERQIEALYRARFEERRNAREDLDQLYIEAAGRKYGSTRAWAIAAARPRLPVVARERLLREEARNIFIAVENESSRIVRSGERRWPGLAQLWSDSSPRPGLRRWIVGPLARTHGGWGDAWATVHDNGSVTLAWVVGGARYSNEGNVPAEDGLVWAEYLETFIADFVSLIRLTADARGAADYDLTVGLEIEAAAADLELVQHSSNGYSEIRPGPPGDFTRIHSRLDPYPGDPGVLQQALDLATDLINQGGLAATRLLG